MNNLPGCSRSTWREILSSSFLVILAAILSAMMGRWAAASPVVSPLTLSSLETGKAVDARMSLSLSQQNFECTGTVTLAAISRLICGDQRQAQVEFKSYNENNHGVLAVYQAGRQQGYLMVVERQGNSYVNTDGVLVLTPGFGSLNNFERYVYLPMKESLSESEMFRVLSPFMKSIGYEINISTLRDRVALKDFQQFVAPKEEPVVAEVEEPEVVIQPLEKEQDGAPVVSIPVPVIIEDKAEIKDEEDATYPETPLIMDKVPEARPQPEAEAHPQTKPRREAKPQRQQPQQRPPKTTAPRRDNRRKKVIMTRGGRTSEVEASNDYRNEPFGNSVPRRHILSNPRGYDLRKMTLKEIEELERRGLIIRQKN